MFESSLVKPLKWTYTTWRVEITKPPSCRSSKRGETSVYICKIKETKIKTFRLVKILSNNDDSQQSNNKYFGMNQKRWSTSSLWKWIKREQAKLQYRRKFNHHGISEYHPSRQSQSDSTRCVDWSRRREPKIFDHPWSGAGGCLHARSWNNHELHYFYQ